MAAKKTTTKAAAPQEKKPVRKMVRMEKSTCKVDVPESAVKSYEEAGFKKVD